MAAIWGIAQNDKYIIECSGQTVYIYNKNKELINKIKGLYYAYKPLIAPNNTLWLKTNAGLMLIYSLDDFSLIKKIKEAKYDSQDGNHILSYDGNYVIDVIYEYGIGSYINFYDINTFEKISFMVNGPTFGITYHHKLKKYLLLWSIPEKEEYLSLADINGIIETKKLKNDLVQYSIIMNINTYKAKKTYDFNYAPIFGMFGDILSYDECINYSFEALYDSLIF